MEKSFFYREESADGDADGMIAGPPRRPGLLGALAWTAGFAGGLVALAAIGTMPFSRRWERKLAPPNGRAETRREFASWGRRMLGRSKHHVAGILGVPPAAAAGLRATTPAVSYWDANTWYYPYDPAEKFAIAIEFRGDRVAAVEFIASP